MRYNYKFRSFSSPKGIVKPGVILLGFVALATQIILLREFLTFFNGNELVIGIILANWMLLTGLGAYLGKFIGTDHNREYLTLLFLSLLAFMPAITVLVLHFAWYSFFPRGIMVGIFHVFSYSLLILGLFCIVSGILFTLFAKQESLKINENKIGSVYAWESLGSLIGGFILNFILIWVFTTFQSLFLIMIFVSIITAILFFKTQYYFSFGILIIITTAACFLFLQNNLDQKVRALAFPGQLIEYTRDSPFGIFSITQQQGQTNYYENNILMASSGDIFWKEESVHFAMIQHKNPKNILVLSGIISGVIDEIIEYPINTIDYVDVNPEIIKIAKNNLNADSYKSVRLIEQDAIRFLKESHKKYDVILINLPKPSTIQLNRYYTIEFFRLLKKNLNDQAVISLSIPASGNYMNKEAKELLSIIYNTLNTAFENVLILPASKDFLVASDMKLTYKIAKTIEELKIPTEYVNSYYFDDDLLQFRSEQIMKQLNLNAPVNKDFSPVFYQSQIKLWMSHFNIKYWIPAVLILLFSGFFFFKTGIVNKGVFAAGFAGTSIEIVLILVFQVLFGYVYAVAGVFIMVFMGGLAYGSFYVPNYFKETNRETFKTLQIAIVVFSFLLPLIFMIFKKIQVPDLVLFVIFTILVLVISVLTGAIFSVACKISEKDYGTIASNVYGLDLIGAATGALLFSIYLIPLLGFAWSIVIVGVLNLIVTTVLRVKI
jgi:spermidine synthase